MTWKLVPWRGRWTIVAYSFHHFVTLKTFTRERGLLLGLNLGCCTTWMTSSTLFLLMLLPLPKSPFFGGIITLVICQPVSCSDFYIFILLLLLSVRPANLGSIIVWHSHPVLLVLCILIFRVLILILLLGVKVCTLLHLLMIILGALRSTFWRLDLKYFLYSNLFIMK